jgi:CheY-like chemotaxis protein
MNASKPRRKASEGERKPSLEPASQQVPAIIPSAPAYPQQRSRLRLLLAEDHPTNQLVATQLLKQLGCRAQVVSNGREALIALRNSPFDLVLMDCQMPEMDGMEATRRIRQGEAGLQRAQIPIVALTANASAGDREGCLAIGMNDYLSKPIRINELRSTLDRWGDQLIGPQPNAGEWKETMASAEPCPAIATIPDVADNAVIPDSQIHNRTRFSMRFGEDQELARRIAAGFLAHMPALLTDLNSAAHGRNSRRVSSLARRLGGAAKGLAAERLLSTAKQMERAAAAEDQSKMRELLGLLESELAALTQLLDAWV